MTKCFSRFAAALPVAAGLLLCSASPVSAQYIVTDLVSNQNPIGSNPADPDLVNAWGIVSTATSPFWVSDNGTGKSTLYNNLGQKQGLVVIIPPANDTGHGQPTAVIANLTANTTGNFVVSVTEGGETKSGTSIFIFATKDGTISGWNPGVLPTEAVIAVNRFNLGTSYTGLSPFTNSVGMPFLYAANNSPGGGIDLFNGDFTFLQTFRGSEIPEAFSPYGLRVIGDRLWVTFRNPNNLNSGFAVVYQINSDGTLTRLFEARGPQQNPWGIALAPANFGPFSNAVLIGDDVTESHINAFNPVNGHFLGRLKGATGQPIVIDRLWGLEFGKGGGANGNTNQLFFTAGPDNYANGLFGMITIK